MAVLRDGVLQQCDTPRALYERPANAFVAGFVGSPAMNMCPARVDDGTAELAGVRLPLPRQTVAAVAAEESDWVIVGFRPESVEPVGPTDGGIEGGIEVCVDVVEELGSDAFCYGTLNGRDPDGGTVDVIARVDPRRPPEKGTTLHVRIRPGETHVFSAVTGRRLG